MKKKIAAVAFIIVSLLIGYEFANKQKEDQPKAVHSNTNEP
ncbi:regulatory protein YycI of two-component signal transduction system YycFG [Paenibacillus mucilaginosus]